LSFLYRLITGFQDSARINQERFSSGRQCHAFSLALKQVNSKFALKILDLFAEGRLRHIQPVSRMSKI